MQSIEPDLEISLIAFPDGSVTVKENLESSERLDFSKAWLVIVWNDPVNLMSYVPYVFQKLFGSSKEEAEKLMLDVHHKGKAVVSKGSREKAELDVLRLHKYGLWATIQED